MNKYYKKAVQLATVLLLITLFHQNSVAIPGWQWAKTAGGTSEERSRSTAIDVYGNVYSTGSFAGSDIVFGNNTLTNHGLEDIFLVKYDVAGNVLWALAFGSDSVEAGYSVCCDISGNVYITGYFGGASLTFGPYTLNNAGNDDIFLVKLDSDGNVLWANSYGGNGNDYGNDLFVGTNDNVYLTGNFNSPSVSFGSTTLVAVGTAKAYVARFDANGNEIWAGGSRGPSYDAGKCVKTDSNGNIYMAGEYYDYPVWFDTDTMMNSGHDDFFIVKYDSSGNELLAKSFGSFDPDKITGLVADDNGEVYFSGHFFSPYIQFDSTTLVNAQFPAWDMYIAKLDMNFNVIWAKSATGNTDEDAIVDMERAAGGNLLVAGWFAGSVTLGNTTLTSNSGGLSDVFAAEIDTSGAFLWAVSAGGADQDYTYSLSAGQNGDAVVGGFFQSDTLPFGGIMLTDNNPGWDMFAAKLSNQTSVSDVLNEKFIIYPNPAGDNFTITFTDQKNYSVELFNSFGQIVYSGQLSHSNQNVSCNGLSNGIYYLRIKGNGETVIQKVVIGN